MQYFEDVCDTLKRSDLIRIMGKEKENFILKTNHFSTIIMFPKTRERDASPDTGGM